MNRVLPKTWSDANGATRVGGVELDELAERFGTPLNVVDEAHVIDRLRAFRRAFGDAAGLTYAGKAFLCGALVRLLDREGWLVDVVSGGELELVRRAGFTMERVVLHGNAKSPRELDRAVRLGVGRVVLDHGSEVAALAEAIEKNGAAPVSVLLRLNIDLDPDTHDKIKTVGPSAHFGMEPRVATEVANQIAGRSELSLAGVHIHAGSQIRDLDVFRGVAEAAVAFVEPIRDRFADVVELDVGGGYAVPYLSSDEVPSLDAYAQAVTSGLDRARATERLGTYRLLAEPGRSVIANAGITLYRVHARKELAGLGHVLAVDGGLSDNPRPSLYDARYEVLNATRRSGASAEFRIVGRHCESGDVVAPSVELPAESAVGDLLAIAATGAYVFAMSSRYNGVGRSAVVFVNDGEAREVVRRETEDDLLACDMAL